MSVARTGTRAGVVAALVMGVGLLGLVVLSCLKGTTMTFGTDQFLQGLGGILGTDTPLEGHHQLIFELVTCKTLVACGVGASLACSGALLQGVFRNGLASPSILGITAGAGLGATLGSGAKRQNAIYTAGGRLDVPWRQYQTVCKGSQMSLATPIWGPISLRGILW
ncbi:MAG: iron chelate uptake ABC transporter family permease subunit, partial [bacterium]